jgi:hypothetical protein
MTKELFIESIEALEKQYRWDEECNQMLEKVFQDSSMLFYDNHYLSNHLLKILQVEFNDLTAHSWIEYFCYERDFGKKKGSNKCVSEIGKYVKFSTPENLYDFLIKNKNQSLIKS